MFKKIITALFFILLTQPLAYAADVTSSDLNNLKDQIAAIRTGSIQSNSIAAETSAKIEELGSIIESLKTAIEANNHLLKTLDLDTDLKLKDSEVRIAALEERLAIQGKQVTAAIAAVVPEAAKEAELYETGLNQINNSEFLKAIATFQKFIDKFPKSDYVPNAQFWIGECHFAMRDYEQSIKEYETLKKKYPKSDKVPSAYLKQGYAFYELDMESDGNVFLKTLIKQYPRTKEAKEAEERMERIKELKDAKKKSELAKSDVPLAPGVAIPETEKNASEKYNDKH